MIETDSRGSFLKKLENLKPSMNGHTKETVPKSDNWNFFELEKLPPVDWLVDQFLVRESVACIYGESGTLKTFLTMTLGYSVALGKSFCGHDCQKGNVVHLWSEDPYAARERSKALMNEWNLAGDQIPLNYRVWGNSFILNLPQDWKVLKDQLSSIVSNNKWNKLDLFIIDTFSTNFMGKEKENDDVRDFIKLCREFATQNSCTVLFVHHTGKDTEKGARGAYTFKANVDTLIQVKLADPYIHVYCDKQRRGEFKPFTLLKKYVNIGESKPCPALVYCPEYEEKRKGNHDNAQPKKHPNLLKKEIYEFLRDYPDSSRTKTQAYFTGPDAYPGKAFRDSWQELHNSNFIFEAGHGKFRVNPDVAPPHLEDLEFNLKVEKELRKYE